MAKRTALDTLIDLAQRASDDAAKRLGNALKAATETEQKLGMLEGFRQDYALRFEQVQQTGITPSVYRNFVAFMDKLDIAIKGQQEMVQHAHRRTAMEKTAWQACERKRLSYRTLNERAAQAALQVENKQDQKRMDEHATRQAYYRK